jgi:hypothetical protein
MRRVLRYAPNHWAETGGFRELGLPTAELESHYREILGDAAGPLFQQIKQELDGA